MAITLVGAGATGNGNDTFSTATGYNTSGADLLVVAWSGTAAPDSITDTFSNTWASAVTDTAFRVCTIYYAWNTSSKVGADHQITLTGTDFFGSAAFLAFTGSQTSSDPKDASTAHTNSFGVTTIQAGSITPAANDEVVIAAVQGDAGGTPTINSSYTALGNPGSGGVYLGGAIGYLIQTTAGATNPTWTFPSSTNGSAAIAAFKAAAGGGGGGGATYSGCDGLGCFFQEPSGLWRPY